LREGSGHDVLENFLVCDHLSVFDDILAVDKPSILPCRHVFGDIAAVRLEVIAPYETLTVGFLVPPGNSETFQRSTAAFFFEFLNHRVIARTRTPSLRAFPGISVRHFVGGRVFALDGPGSQHEVLFGGTRKFQDWRGSMVGGLGFLRKVRAGPAQPDCREQSEYKQEEQKQGERESFIESPGIAAEYNGEVSRVQEVMGQKGKAAPGRIGCGEKVALN